MIVSPEKNDYTSQVVVLPPQGDRLPVDQVVGNHAMSSHTRSPTHEEVSSAALAKLALALDDAVEEGGGGALEHRRLVTIAESCGTPVSQYYAASLLTEIVIAEKREIKFVFCVGACQRWGALACIDHAAERLAERTAKGQTGFDIAVRQCFDKCERAAVCEVTTPDGKHTITEASPAKLDAVISEL